MIDLSAGSYLRNTKRMSRCHVGQKFYKKKAAMKALVSVTLCTRGDQIVFRIVSNNEE